MLDRRTLADDAADWALGRSVQEAGVAGVVALAADKHDVVYQRAIGLRAVDQPPVMTLDTVFAIASMTRAGTAVARRN